MELTATEARVLGCLVERQVAVADEPAATLDELRFACNRTSGRDPVVALDDRAVEDALLALKSMGLARFVATGRTGTTIYRHRADERWRLNRYELGALAVLLLRGSQSTEQVRVALVGQSAPEAAGEVEAALDALAGRTPTPLAARIPGGNGETLWVEALTDRFRSPTTNGHPVGSSPGVLGGARGQRSSRSAPGLGAAGATAAGSLPAPTLADVMERLTNIERRLTGIEAALGALRSATRPETLRQP
jgi:uncharacterized protein